MPGLLVKEVPIWHVRWNASLPWRLQAVPETGKIEGSRATGVCGMTIMPILHSKMSVHGISCTIDGKNSARFR